MRLIRLLVLVISFSLFLVFGCSDTNSIIEIQKWSEEIAVPEYYKDHIKKKEAFVNDAIRTANDNYASFIFFTDAHWGANYKNSPTLINHIIHNVPIKDVFFGGDVITTSFDNPDDAYNLGMSFRAAFDTLNCNMYFLYGNHDNNSDSQPDLLSLHLSEDQVYNFLQCKMGPCTYGGYYNFFIDREHDKTRFLCLDTGRFYYSHFRDKTINTIRFIIDALNTTPEGWHVVIISHIWCGLKKNANNKYEPYIPAYYNAILKIFDDYNNACPGTFSYNGSSITYDFSNASSRVICCIGGHNHLDALLYSLGGIPIIINTTDSRQTINGDHANARTIDEQSVSVYIIDYVHSILFRFRVGRGSDLAIPIIL